MTFGWIIVGVYLLLLLLLRWREPHLIYFPSREIETTPTAAGLKYEDVSLTTVDGAQINGWFLPATDPTTALTVLFFHGNAGNISHRLEKCALFHELGAAVLVIDYHGYGRSEGQPSEAATYQDARAAYEYLTRQRAVVPARLIVYGESLGAAVAVQLATEVPTGGVVLEEPFSSAVAVGQKMFPFVPVRLIARNKYDSLAKIGRLRAPLLLLHSRDDEYFSPTHAERLLAAAPAPKRFVELRGSHNDAFVVSAAVYRRALEEFFAERTSAAAR